MAPSYSPSLSHLALLLLSYGIGVLALQVTPNSPCSSVCVDLATGSDYSDPSSSNTKNSDITCRDASIASSSTGIAWETCMNCLQNSTFSQGSENDQKWFLYNLRYAVSYCVFGFPNATDVGTSPCVTSFACEPLQTALEEGVLSPQDSIQYGYCAVNGSIYSQPTISRCSSCIAASGDMHYLTNYLTALEAGCVQQPAVGKVLGLNSTLFSSAPLGIVDPSTIVPTANNDGSHGLPATTVAVIVICVIVFLLVVSAFTFIHYKKRQNRAKRASLESSTKRWGGKSQQPPQSPLSFQCQTHMGPPTPKFFPDKDMDERVGDEGVGYAYYPTSETNSFTNPTDGNSPARGRKNSLWKPHNSMSSFQNISAVTEQQQPQYEPAQPQKKKVPTPHTQNPLQYHPTTTTAPVPLHSLNTTTLPSYRSVASPGSALSPFSPASYTAPTSAASVRSTAPLLPKTTSPPVPAYVPANYGAGSASRGPDINTSASPSPLLSGAGWPPASSTEQQKQPSFTDRMSALTASKAGGAMPSPSPGLPPPAPPPKSPRMLLGTGGGKKKESGSPTERRVIETNFPAPPPRR